jgi:hypothetical protein
MTKGQTMQWPKEEGQTIQWPKEEGQTIQLPKVVLSVLLLAIALSVLRFADFLLPIWYLQTRVLYLFTSTV